MWISYSPDGGHGDVSSPVSDFRSHRHTRTENLCDKNHFSKMGPLFVYRKMQIPRRTLPLWIRTLWRSAWRLPMSRCVSRSTLALGPDGNSIWADTAKFSDIPNFTQRNFFSQNINRTIKQSSNFFFISILFRSFYKNSFANFHLFCFEGIYFQKHSAREGNWMQKQEKMKRFFEKLLRWKVSTGKQTIQVSVSQKMCPE